MSDQYMRQDRDKWECEMLDEMYRAARQEADELARDSKKKDDTILHKTQEYEELLRRSKASLKKVSRKQYKSFRVPTVLAAIFVFFWILAEIGVATQTLSYVVGDPVILVCTLATSFLGGVMLERATHNLMVLKVASVARKSFDKDLKQEMHKIHSSFRVRKGGRNCGQN